MDYEKRRQNLLNKHGGEEGLKNYYKELQKKRRQTLLNKLGDEQKLSDYYRELQKKSRINYSGNGGLRGVSDEKRKEIQAMGVEAAREAKRKNRK